MMKEYAEQPQVLSSCSEADLKSIIQSVLEEDLPDCVTNRWFVDSVNFANMIDKIVEKVIEND